MSERSQEDLVLTGLSGLAAFDSMKDWKSNTSFQFGKLTGIGKLNAIHFGISIHKILMGYS
jgi:hypothetical protein